jgi:hypothetical protein
MTELKLGEVVGQATVKMPSGAEITGEEKLGLTLSEGPVGTVTIELSHTKNLGNYQSAKLTVGLSVPTNISVDALDKTFEYAKTWCDVKLTALIDEIDHPKG